MQARDCPLCLHRVLVMGNGICPSCGKSIAGLPEPEQVAMAIEAKRALPAMCITCVTPTARTEPIAASEKPASGVPTWLQLLLSLPVMLLSPRAGAKLGAGALAEGNALRSVRMTVPRCETCAKSGPLKPLRIDLAGEKITVVVHRQFRAACQAPPATGTG